MYLYLAFKLHQLFIKLIYEIILKNVLIFVYPRFMNKKIINARYSAEKSRTFITFVCGTMYLINRGIN